MGSGVARVGGAGVGFAKFEGSGGMVVGSPVARAGAGVVVVRTSRVEVMVLVRVTWTVGGDGWAEGISWGAMPALARRAAPDGDGGVCLVLGWLG